MADNIFRSSRGRDPIVRSDVDQGASDPLAELARLIGRSEPRGGRHGGYAAPAPAEDPEAPALDWAADESYAPEHNRRDDRYAPPLDDSYSSHPEDRSHPEDGSYPEDRGYARDRGYAQDRGYADEEARDDGAADDAGYYDAQEPPASGQRSGSFAPGASDRYEVEDQDYDDTRASDSDEAYRDAPRRRGGLVVVVAVLGLAVLGTAGAFGYRAMFGGSVLPTLPPIIKPANGPNKIVPSYGDGQASNAGEGATDANSPEKLVSHEEQPVEMQEAPKAPPRVVSTIPVAPNQAIAPPGMTAPGSPFNAAPPPGTAPMPPPPVVGAPASGAAPQMAAPAPPPAAAPAGPRKVHTVVIRADQPADADAAAAPAPPPPAQRSAPRTAAPAPKSNRAAGGGNQPLSLAPGASNEAAPPAPAPAPRTHSAAVPPAAAAPPPASEPAPAPASAPSSGGYSVQVSSQRSEADAQASFRELQAKYPNQLGGREATVRRADLGAKGTYYRALVGPFASAEQAAAMCSSLKAAGGNCLVQRN